jgi:hypothetical protein
MVEFLENKKAILISGVAGIAAGVLSGFLFNKIHNNLNEEKKKLYINLKDIYSNFKTEINNIHEEHYEMDDATKKKNKKK